MKEVEARLRIIGKDDTGAMAKSVGNKLDYINKHATALDQKQSAIAARAKATFASIVQYAAPAAMAYAARAALLDFAAIDREMTRIGNTASASTEDVSAAFETMREESKRLAMPMSEAVVALDKLVSSGMNLQEAMAFLPSVLATTQASGAAADEIADAGLKTSSAFLIKAEQMQHAFDLMVASGQDGQFELKDMARYLPELSNSFARLGYTGEDGLKRLLAGLQTVREDTGSAQEAADDFSDVLQKMTSKETISNFNKFGINLEEEMAKAKKSGEDTLDAFIRLSREAVHGDLSKLPQLFGDKQVIGGMTSLMTSIDSLTKHYQELNKNSVDGTVARNNVRLLNDTQASVDRLSESFDRLEASAGRAIAKVAVPAMDTLSGSMDYNTAVQNGSEKSGHGFWSGQQWGEPFREYAASMGFKGAREMQDRLAFEGGYRDPKWLNGYMTQNWPDEAGRRGPGSAPAAAPSTKGFFRLPSRSEFMDAMKIDLHGEDLSRPIVEGSKKAGETIEQSGTKAGDAIDKAGNAIASVMAGIAAKFSSINTNPTAVAPGGTGTNGVNADRGRTMSPDVINGNAAVSNRW